MYPVKDFTLKIPHKVEMMLLRSRAPLRKEHMALQVMGYSFLELSNKGHCCCTVQFFYRNFWNCQWPFRADNFVMKIVDIKCRVILLLRGFD